jgi:DNA-binding LacI/PurR family transcriptional regulator
MHIRESHLLDERFQDEVIAAVVDAGTAAGYSILLELTRDTDSPAQLARLGDLRADGTVLLDGRSQSPVAPVLAANANPTVVLVNPELEQSFGSIDADFEGGAYRMVTYLIKLGHRRIAHIGDDLRLHSSRQRHLGYECAIRDAGLDVDPNLTVIAGYMRHHGVTATKELLVRAPDFTAIFCVNDLTAFGAIDCLTAQGRRVPDDVSVTGYDDIAAAQHHEPPISTIHIPWYEMAEASTTAVIAAIERGESPSTHVFAVDQVIRSTTGPVRPSRFTFVGQGKEDWSPTSRTRM